MPRIDPLTFASVISLALKRAKENGKISIKIVANWTGANERTVKNWFNGKFGPNGDHLMVLANQCDEVMDAIIQMSGRNLLSVSLRMDSIEENLVSALKHIRSIRKQSGD